MFSVKREFDTGEGPGEGGAQRKTSGKWQRFNMK